MQRRADFPFFLENRDIVYLDSSATTHKPKCVLDAMTKFYTKNYATVHRSVYRSAKEATASYEKTRKAVANFIKADTDEIIFTRGTTASLNLIARSFGKAFLKPGDVVLISEMEHHSNIIPWQLLEEERGIVLDTIPIDVEGNILLAELQKKLNSHVKVVSIAHISHVLGTIHPIKEIAKMVHNAGAVLVIDGAQAIPHLPINVKELDADFYAFSSHKMYGPTGVGVLFGKRELLEKMPPIDGGGDMIEKVSLKKTTYADPPMRFEAGTPMIAEVIGLGAAIDYLTSIKNIYSYEKELVDYALSHLLQIDHLKILGNPSQRGSLITFTIKDLHPLDIATMLDCKNICLRSGHLCSQPAMQHYGIESALRISFGLYNTTDDIDKFIAALKHTCHLLRQ